MDLNVFIEIQGWYTKIIKKNTCVYYIILKGREILSFRIPSTTSFVKQPPLQIKHTFQG